MTPEEKIQYVKDKIDEETAISPKGPIWYFLYSIGHPDNPEEWTILTRDEQKRIIKKLEEEKYIKNVELSEDGKGFWLEKVLKRTRRKKSDKTKRSNLYSYINTTDELLQHRELFQKALKIIGEIQPNHKYKHSTYEENDDLIQLLIDLDLIEYDWKEIEKQKHREVGNRIIEFSFEANKIIALKERVSGKNGKVRKEALELISRDIGERFTLNEIVEIFTDIGVPESMFIQDTKWRAVFYILSYYTTSKDASNHAFFLRILERFLHPLSFAGDEEKAEDTQEQYRKWLKYDKIKVDGDKVSFGREEKKHINRIKEIYILSAINLYKHTDGDYLCDNGELVQKRFHIDKDDYFSIIEKLEKEDVVVYEEKCYEDEHTEFTYDGRKVEHEKLYDLLQTYRKWCGYKDDIDLHSIPVLSKVICKHYKEENLLDAIIGLSEGLYSGFNNNLEETLYYYLSAKDKVAHTVNGLEALARMFDMKYHDAEYLLGLEPSFFDVISAFFRDLLDEESYKFWFENLPEYVKRKTNQNDKGAPSKEQSDNVVRHEMEVFFKNSMQEKDIVLNHKYNKTTPSGVYIEKRDDDFYYKGDYIKLSKKSDYYKVFCAIYSKVSNGGFISYKELIAEVKNRVPKTKNMTDEKVKDFILNKITNKQNGFMRASKIPITQDNGKPLFETERGSGIAFNNKMG